MTVKTRSSRALNYFGNRKVWSSTGPLVSNVNHFAVSGSVERVTTFDSAWWAHRRMMRKDPHYRKLFGHRNMTGGFFAVQRVEDRLDSRWCKPERYQGATLVERYDGYLATQSSPKLLTTQTLPSLVNTFTMDAAGTVGWNRAKPTKPQAGMGQFIGELHDVPFSPKRILEMRHLFQELLHDAPKAGSKAYIAWEFGWRPFIKDLKDLLQQIKDIDKNIQQLARDNGRSVRRGAKISKTGGTTASATTSATGGGFSWPSLHTSMYLEPEQKVTVTTTSAEYWFSGRFTYFIGKDHYGFSPLDIRRRQQLNRILFGVDFTDLHTLYQLIPWSWLVDWVLPVGPIIDNLLNDPVDNLTADYAFVMCHQLTQTKETVTGRFSDGPYSVTYTRNSETKQRQAATPYGFGLLPGGFSLKQLSILAALGISKVT
jgi:hypothetical protein